MEWILVIFVHASVMSQSDSMAITNVPAFNSMQECQAAGKQAEKLTAGTTKDTRYVCLQRKKA